MIYSPSGAWAGIGFAIPVDVVKKLVPQLIAHRRPVVPGIGIVALPESMAQRNQLEGVVLQEVVPDSPAAKAGLEGVRRPRGGGFYLGDSIVAVNGKRIESFDDMTHIFEQQGVGTIVELTVVRRSEKRKVRVPLVAVSLSSRNVRLSLPFNPSRCSEDRLRPFVRSTGPWFRGNTQRALPWTVWSFRRKAEEDRGNRSDRPTGDFSVASTRRPEGSYAARRV